MKRILVIIPSLFLLSIINLSADIPFKVLRGGEDTVYNQKHTIICQTSPSNLAIIEEQQVKVYNTGAFGAQVTLKEGNNDIEITLFQGKVREIKHLNIYYNPNKPAKKEKRYTLAQFEQMTNETTLHPRLFYGTTTEGSYLQYGDGSDRLGGSKMNFIDTGILLKVVGEIGSLYKVELSKNRYAFIPTKNIKLSNKTTKIVNTSSWHISNTGKYDRVGITLPERLPYTTFTKLDPTTIYIDIFGAMCNSNWIAQTINLRAIDYVDFEQRESDIFRVIIKLKEKYSWGYSINYEGNNLVINVKHTPELTLKGMIVGLDAGHGGPDSPGAISLTGIKEKDVNLQIVKQVKQLLEKKGATVVLSRDSDRDVSIDERKKIFKENEVDIALSIHNNAGGSPLNPMGTSTYYKHVTNRDLAATMLNRLLEANLKNFGLIGNFNFSLNAPTEYPNALLEILFMSSIYDEAILADPVKIKNISEQIVKGLEDYLLLVKDSIPAPPKSKKRR